MTRTSGCSLVIRALPPEQIQAWHRNIHQHDLGTVRGNQTQRRPTIAGFRNHLDIGKIGQQRAETGSGTSQ